MSLFKRISTAIYAQLDRAVGEIENHDALIRAAIGEQRRRIAAAKVQLGRMRASEQKAARELEELEKSERLWAERAVRASKEDEPRALACLQRRQAVRDRILRVAEAREAFRQAAERMSADIGRCEEELAAMSRKHELMRARQASVDASRICTDFGCSGLDELERSLERWEISIAQGEVCTGLSDSMDSLEREYINEEREQRLRAELEELLNGEEKRHDDA
jgi:phage shock protein A